MEIPRHLGYILCGATRPFEDFRRLLFPNPPKRDARGNKIFGDLSPLIAGGEYHFLLDKLRIGRAKHPNEIMAGLLRDRLKRNKTENPDEILAAVERFSVRIANGLGRLHETRCVAKISPIGVRGSGILNLDSYVVTPFGEHIHRLVHELNFRLG